MDRATSMGKDSAKGSLQLFIGRTLSTLIMAVGSIILALIISPGDLGLYAIALIPATTFALFQDWGVNSAIIKYCAQFRAKEKDEKEIGQVILSGLTFEITTGIILTVISILTANFVAVLLHRPDAVLLISLASLTILSGSILGSAQAVFVGCERMVLITYGMIVQAVGQCVLPVFLVYEGYGALGAVLGYVLSTISACIFASLLLYFGILRKLHVNLTKQINFRQNLRPLLNYGIPLATGTIIGSIVTQVSSFIIPSVANNAMIGNYKIAINFAIILTFFTAPITTVLFPAFSKIDPHSESSVLKTVFSASVKYASLFLLPATMAMMVLSKSIVSTIYSDKYPYAPYLLSLYIIVNLFVIFGSLSSSNLLSALGETKLLMKLNLAALFIGLPLAFFLIPLLGIPGMIITSFSAGLPGLFFILYWLWKNYKIKLEFKSPLKIFISSLVAAIVTFVYLTFISAPAWLLLITGLALFLLVYLVAIPISGAVSQDDINNLRTMLLGMGWMSKILEIPLSFIERLLRKFLPTKKQSEN